MERLRGGPKLDVVLVVIDTLRADATTPYTPGLDTTPEIARWAEQGVVFEDARAQSSWTKISMASLLTSLWPRSHAIRDATDGLASDAVTLAESFSDAGYATAAVQTNGWLDQSFGFQQGFDRYVFPRGARRMGTHKPALWPSAERVVDEARRAISTADPDQPLFLYLHFMDVHEFAAPPPYRRFGTDTKGAYLAALNWCDEALGEVRHALDRAGRLDRSLLVLASDHGETFGEHDVHGHARNVLTPVLHVPIVIRFPFRTEPIRVPDTVRNLDLAPTLLDLAGIAVPPSFEGVSLAPLIEGTAAGAPGPAFAALGFPLFPDASVQASISDRSWTYARNAREGETWGGAYPERGIDPGAELLFDRAVDPGERVNLAGREPGEATRLREVLDAHLAGPDAGVAARGVRIDPGIAERLRAMGYLQ